MMKKKTVRLVSGIVAGILVGAMLVSVVASGIVYAGAASSAELKDKLSSLEEQKTEIKKELDSTASKVSDVEATRAALQKEIALTKEEIDTVKAYIARLQDQIDVKSTELEAAQQALAEKEDTFAETVRTTYEEGEISYLEVLLNSSSFSDLLNRIEIVSSIMDDNKKIVAEYTAAKEDIQQKRDDLQKTQDEYGQIAPVYSISAGLDYPGIGPEHAFLHDIGRAEYVPVTDDEAVNAFEYLSRIEGIIPAIESAHAVAHAMKIAPAMDKDKIIVINISGRGDKDCAAIARYRGEDIHE